MPRTRQTCGITAVSRGLGENPLRERPVEAFSRAWLTQTPPHTLKPTTLVVSGPFGHGPKKYQTCLPSLTMRTVHDVDNIIGCGWKTCGSLGISSKRPAAGLVRTGIADRGT